MPEQWMYCTQCKQTVLLNNSGICLHCQRKYEMSEQPDSWANRMKGRNSPSSRLDKLQDGGLIGCLDNTGITSENYKNQLGEVIKYSGKGKEFKMLAGETVMETSDAEWGSSCPVNWGGRESAELCDSEGKRIEPDLCKCGEPSTTCIVAEDGFEWFCISCLRDRPRLVSHTRQCDCGSSGPLVFFKCTGSGAIRHHCLACLEEMVIDGTYALLDEDVNVWQVIDEENIPPPVKKTLAERIEEREKKHITRSWC